MRVIAGEFRGRALDAPQGRGTRPITDMAKGTIFNILGSRFGTLASLPDLDVLDLFAGSGSFGIEALSRGVRSCTFAERSRSALQALRGNLARLRLAPPTAIVSVCNIWEVLPGPPRCGGYGLAFVDPPYQDVEDTLRVADLLESVSSSLADDGIAVFRHDARTPFVCNSEHSLKPIDERVIGSMRVWFFQRCPRRQPANDPQSATD